MLTSYKRYVGTAISIWDTTSAVGVSTAEAVTMPRSAYLLPAGSCAGVTVPRRASSTTTSGTGNNSPHERTKAVADEVNAAMQDIGTGLGGKSPSTKRS